MSHYFINDNSVKSNKRSLYYECDGVRFRFNSDNGVFSKSEIDDGSDTLLHSYLENGKQGRACRGSHARTCRGIIIRIYGRNIRK